MDEGVKPAPGSPAAILPASWRDLNAVRHLEQVCFPKDAWPLWDIISVLTLPNVLRLKATIGEQMVGFIACDIRPRQNIAWIATIAVMPEHRRIGIGSQLLETCEGRIRTQRLRLNVRKTNQVAIKLYQQSGYSQVGVWPGYYDDGEDALILEKERG